MVSYDEETREVSLEGVSCRSLSGWEVGVLNRTQEMRRQFALMLYIELALAKRPRQSYLPR